jgi:hypothetical protein
MTQTLAKIKPTPMVRKVEFPNLHSRLLLKGMFQRQHFIPEKPPWLLETVLSFVERRLMRIDISDIRIDRPIFLLGLPRSGTSLLQDLCVAHPELGYITNGMNQFHSCFCAAELVRHKLKIDVRGERFVGDGIIVSGDTPNEAPSFWGRWFRWDPYNLRYVPRSPDSFTAEEVEGIHETLRKVLWCFGKPWRRLFVKNPALFSDLGVLPRLFPDAKYIHIIRDPRYCANSMRKLYQLCQKQLEFIHSQRKHGYLEQREFISYPRVPKLADYVAQWGADNVQTPAQVWKDCIAIARDWSSRLGSYLELRYEDLLANPHEQMARIFAFCELSPICEDNKKFWGRLVEVGQVHHQNNYGDFDLIESICHEEMRTLGYV